MHMFSIDNIFYEQNQSNKQREPKAILSQLLLCVYVHAEWKVSYRNALKIFTPVKEKQQSAHARK